MLKGECYCGTVKYSVNGDLIRMYCCHCRTCRKVTGASFSTTAVIDPALFTIEEGADSVVEVPQGPHARNHCEKCHCWVFSRSEPFPQVMFIPCGTLVDSPKRKVDYHVFYSEKAAWVDVGDAIPVYPEMLPQEELEQWRP